MSDSKKIVRFPNASSVEAEAAEWVARLEADTRGTEDYAKFQEWLNRSPLHREAAARYFGLWSDFDALKNFVPSDKTDADDESSWSLTQLWNGWLATPWRSLAAAASIVVALTAGGLLLSSLGSAPPATMFYQTAVGDQKTVHLPDGSTVFINTDSEIEVTYSDARREVHLKRGEAYFDVAHDESRPFTVYSGGRVIRDIGTAFDVRVLPKGVEVTVTKGSVELTARADAAAVDRKEQRLGVVTAGQNAVFSNKIEYIKPVSDTHINRQLSWRQGILVYTGEPLAQVVADISRYTRIKIELADPKLGEIPVGGYFAVNKLDAVFVALEKNFGIHADWSDESHVRLSAAGPDTMLPN